MTIETITIIGIVIQTSLFMLGGYSLVVRHDESTKYLKTEMQGMQHQLQKLSEVITQMAVQTIRVDNLNNQVTMLQKTVEELRRGTGFVRGTRTAVDGEYPEG
jgi:prefoldin subunit 5